MGDLPSASTGMWGVHSEGTGVDHELDAAGGEVEQVDHLVLAVPNKPLVVPRHKLAGNNDIRFKALLVPASIPQ